MAEEAAKSAQQKWALVGKHCRDWKYTLGKTLKGS